MSLKPRSSQKSGPTSVSLFRPKLLQHKLSLLSTVEWKRSVRVFMDLLWVKKVSSLSMILTCLKKKSMELSLPLSCSASGWTTVDGMISPLLNGTSAQPETSDSVLPWAHQVAVALQSLTVTCATSISCMLSLIATNL